jgi:1,4-alpha-glucan branching enzyme
MKKIPLIEQDGWLAPHQGSIEATLTEYNDILDELTDSHNGLINFSGNHHFFGLHPHSKGWIFREWAPNASAIYLIGDF